MKIISVVIPIHNEENNIHELFDSICASLMSLRSYSYELIFINDGSSDSSLEILKNLKKTAYCDIKIINLSRNFGQQFALKAGYDHARGDAVISMDADLQNPPELLLKMIKIWQTGIDIVLCKRTNGDQKSGVFKNLSSKIYYRIINSISEIKIEANVPDFRLVDRRVLREFKNFNEVDLFYRGIVAWVGFKKFTLYYKHSRRYSGQSSYGFIKMLKLGVSGITSFSLKPLIMSLLLGAAIIIIDILFIVYALIIHFLGYSISGWTSLIVAIMFFGGVQLFFIGIVGLYVGKIFTQVKGRPQYIIDEVIE